MTERSTGKATVRVGLSFAALSLLAMSLALPAAPAMAEVPVPRLSPKSDVALAMLTTAPPAAPIRMGPRLPLRYAIEREAKVDVSIAVAEFYAARDYEPVWTEERAEALRARLAAAAGDGLDPDDYSVPRAAPGVFSAAAEDVTLTEAALRYANDAYSGRLEPRSVSRIMTIEPPKLNEARFLRRIARAGNIDAVLESVHPQHPQFQALRGKLREMLGESEERPPAVGAGPNLKRGVHEPRVAILRTRLGATLVDGDDPNVFDEVVEEAVKAYQRERGLMADGIVGPHTLRLIDEGAGEAPIATLISNMERWRWMPRSLGEHNVFVNIPKFEVTVTQNGAVTYEGRVIVGAPGTPTPIFSDEIQHMVVNPYWNVPYSIASSEMLGGIRANPSGYFARRGYEAVYNGRVVNPASISWNRDTLRRVRIRQKPGRNNALGSVKFMFPNEHAVYLHDTPTKHLFSRDGRALSHGCVRVDQPFEFADALLSEETDLSGKALERMVGGKERWLKMAVHIPVHLAYFTREVGPDGALVRYGDIYGYDARTQRALGL
ncbi:L,D-transpeptidase family protein [Acuticoccus sp. M5D2P5]|uniref:L,D-transpeptidase family protein n=1 Tax=Acuticoccus kalidii TaxID=2910977 RepID=UPI001F028CDB|nr:L,D-transpeptidase family protein [Acuticoccus kalidii]MCF3932168.1 L,D-transpeptidase family protein [Acuticoccus kalidii]